MRISALVVGGWLLWPLAAPAAEPGAVPGDGLLRLALGLLAVLAAIGASAWLFRRLGRWPAAAGALRVLGGLSLGARERVVLVQVGETQLLLGVAPGRVQTLHVLARPVALDPAAAGAGLAERLAARWARRGDGAGAGEAS